MTRWNQGVITTLFGVVLLRLSLTGDYLLYVKAGMRPLLVAAGLLLGVLGAFLMVRHHRGASPLPVSDDAAPAGLRVGEGDGHDHDHDRGPRLAWLLMLPVLSVFMASPQPLGAFAAARQAARTPSAPPESEGGDFVYPPLGEPGPSGSHEMAVVDFVSRSIYDTEQGMRGAKVRLVGFVTPDPGGAADRFRLTRFVLSCCAADGSPVYVDVHLDGRPPVPDTWVSVDGQWQPAAGDAQPDVPVVRARAVTTVQRPADPYEG